MALAPDHPELNDQLNAYLDGELDATQRARVEAHLAACDACRLDLDQLRLTRTAVGALPALRAPRPFTITAPAFVEGAAGGGRGRSGLLGALAWAWRLGSVATAACLVVAGLVANQVLPAGGASLASRAEYAKAEDRQAAPGAAGAALADRDSSQRVAPRDSNALQAAQRGPARGEGAAAPSLAGAPPQAATPGAAEPAPRRIAEPAGGLAQAPASAAPGSPAAPAEQGASTDLSRSRPADAPVDTPAAVKPGPGAARVTSSAPWLLLALLLAACSAVAFAVERRIRRAAPAALR